MWYYWSAAQRQYQINEGQGWASLFTFADQFLGNLPADPVMLIARPALGRARDSARDDPG